MQAIEKEEEAPSLRRHYPDQVQRVLSQSPISFQEQWKHPEVGTKIKEFAEPVTFVSVVRTI